MVLRESVAHKRFKTQGATGAFFFSKQTPEFSVGLESQTGAIAAKSLAHSPALHLSNPFSRRFT